MNKKRIILTSLIGIGAIAAVSVSLTWAWYASSDRLKINSFDIDMNGNVVEDKSVKDYFVDNYDTDIKDQVVHDMRAPTLAFSDAEQLSRKLGTFRVFNATRGGKLEVFERVNFDEIIR